MKSHRAYLYFLSSLCSLCLCGESWAQGEASKPYDIQIVVHVAQNRLLTDVFREGIERELHDGFQAGLGDMGRVTVTHEHPRLGEVLARGLRVLDGWTERSEIKTHFVLIDFSGVHYEIQARQYDGTTRRPSPVIRRDRTRDRDFVAKSAALLIKQDFGILGTILTEPEGPQKRVKIELRGGALGSMAPWVKKDDIFALAPPGGGTAVGLKWSLLQVEESPAEKARGGRCLCRLFHRYRLKDLTGYRCIKLGTVRTALRLRWMQEVRTTDQRVRLRPLDNDLTMDIRRFGFQGEDATRLRKSTGPGGIVETIRDGDKGVFTNVAFVSIVGISGTKPQVPIALVDDQLQIVEINAARDDNTLFTVRKSAWQSDVTECRSMQINLFKTLETLGADPEKRGQIIQEAENGLKRSREDRARLKKQRGELLKEANGTKFDTAREDKRLADMEKSEHDLEQFIAAQKEIEKTENDPQLKKWRSEIGRAQLLEKDLEFEKALAIYTRIKKEGFKNADLDKHIEDVRKVWKPPADAEHKDAREFIYRVWPTLDTDRLDEGIAKARKAFERCQKAGDIVSVRKLFKGIETHADRVTKEGLELRPEINVDDEQPAKHIKKVGADLLKLGQEVQEYLQKKQPADQ